METFDAIRTVLAVRRFKDTPIEYPADAVGKGRKKRKPLGEVAYHERWGEPYE